MIHPKLLFNSTGKLICYNINMNNFYQPYDNTKTFIFHPVILYHNKHPTTKTKTNSESDCEIIASDYVNYDLNGINYWILSKTFLFSQCIIVVLFGSQNLIWLKKMENIKNYRVLVWWLVLYYNISVNQYVVGNENVI